MPREHFRLGSAEDDLGVEDASLGGVLPWYSLIHTKPELMGLALNYPQIRVKHAVQQAL